MSGSIEQKPQRCWFPKPYSDFVARARVPSGFVLLVAFAWFSRPSRHSILLGLPVAALGLWLRAWATGHLAKDRQLATTGPYAYIRNPLYVGTLIAAAGIALASRSILLTVVLAAVFSLVYLPVIELEEQHLREIFPGYQAYATQVRRFFPAQRWRGARMRFSLSNYMRNEEYKALLGFLLAAAWLVWRSRAL